MEQIRNDIRKILVTGGAGFIGSAVIRELNQWGAEVAVLDNLSFGRRELAAVPDTHFFQQDIRDREAVFAVMQLFQPDWVLHLAAVHFIPYCNEHPYESADINIRGTVNVLDAARNFGVKGVFFASTAAVYPIHDHATDELFPTGPLDIYGLTKFTGERLCREFHLESGIPTIVCRFFNAFGPNETNPHLIPEIQRQVNEGLRTIALGNLEPKRDFIHTSDMARAVRMLLQRFDKGFDMFNLGRGIEYSVREIVEAFSRQLGETITIDQDPARMRKTDRMHLLANIHKLKEFAGWEPLIGIDEGIATLIEKA